MIVLKPILSPIVTGFEYICGVLKTLRCINSSMILISSLVYLLFVYFGAKTINSTYIDIYLKSSINLINDMMFVMLCVT